MNYTKGEWKKYGQHIHINTANTSDEIATILWPDWMPESEAKANAHLIAASPRMADLLQRLVIDGWSASISEEAKEILQTLA